jgi:hypothetical protein
MNKSDTFNVVQCLKKCILRFMEESNSKFRAIKVNYAATIYWIALFCYIGLDSVSCATVIRGIDGTSLIWRRLYTGKGIGNKSLWIFCWYDLNDPKLFHWPPAFRCIVSNGPMNEYLSPSPLLITVSTSSGEHTPSWKRREKIGTLVRTYQTSARVFQNVTDIA